MTGVFQRSLTPNASAPQGAAAMMPGEIRERRWSDVKVINCKEGHELIKITAASDDELVQKGREHLRRYHPELANMGREQILAMATNE